MNALSIVILALVLLASQSAMAQLDDCFAPGAGGNGGFDAVVSLGDINAISSRYGTQPSANGSYAGDGYYYGDVNGNDLVDLSDVNTVGAAFGKEACSFLKRSTVQAKPIDGSSPYVHSDTAWAQILAWADKSFDANDRLCTPGSDDDLILLAKAIVSVRFDGTSNETPGGLDTAELAGQAQDELDNVRTTTAEVMGDENSGCECEDGPDAGTDCDSSTDTWIGDDEGMARNVTGYVHSAFLIDYHSSAMKDFFHSLMFDSHQGTIEHTLEDSVKTRVGNTSAYAMGSFIAAAAYTGRWDQIDYVSDSAFNHWKRQLGDRTATSGDGDFDANDWVQSASVCGSSVPPKVGVISQLAIDDAYCTDGLMDNEQGSGTFDGFGLMASERTFDSATQYPSPWLIDGHENGYWMALVGASMGLQTNGRTLTDAQYHSFAGAFDAMAQVMGGDNWRYGTGSCQSGGCNHPLHGNDLNGNCWALAYNSGDGVREDYFVYNSSTTETGGSCCASYGSGSSGVGHQLGFLGFVFPGSVTRDACTPTDPDGL